MAGRCWLASLFVMHWSEAARGDGGGDEGFAKLTAAAGDEGDGDHGGITDPLRASRERRSETLYLRLHAPCFYPTFAQLTMAGRDGQGSRSGTHN